jgi:hypothetical protein
MTGARSALASDLLRSRLNAGPNAKEEMTKTVPCAHRAGDRCFVAARHLSSVIGDRSLVKAWPSAAAGLACCDRGAGCLSSLLGRADSGLQEC